MAIKGLTFSKQFFTSDSWRLSTRRFFGNEDGKLYGLNITTGGNNVIIGTGFFVICGGLIQVVSQETISAGTSGTKTLCYQLDMSKVNTDNNFNQGSFVWITGNPTQEDLFGSGTIYQLPLIRVVTNGTSISSSTLLVKDVNWEIETKCKLKGDFATITGTFTATSSTTINIEYPSGYNKDNCCIISHLVQPTNATTYWCQGNDSFSPVAYMRGMNAEIFILGETQIQIQASPVGSMSGTGSTTVTPFNFKIVLMKL